MTHSRMSLNTTQYYETLSIMIPAQRQHGVTQRTGTQDNNTTIALSITIQM
jgi:hypothetical protein